MNKKEYIVVYRDPDGGISVRSYTQNGIKRLLEENRDSFNGQLVRFLDDLSEIDPRYWKGEYAYLIIKGSIVVPKITKIVEKLEI